MGIHKKVRKLKAGSVLALEAERITDPVVVSGVSGTRDKPVYIRGKKPVAPNKNSAKRSPSVFATDETFKDFNQRANTLARAHEASGEFPGVYFMADQAQLILRDCQWIVLEDLTFENCWPTAIYIENCQHITIRGVHIRGGTFAIGATGTDTRHLLIEDCDWIQDPSCHGDAQIRSIRDHGYLKDEKDLECCHLFRQTDWNKIHADSSVTGKPVQDDDARAYDGDFFRAWTIAGYVILRNNCIMDAFNGIHFFNQLAKDAQKRCSRNVMISDNWFVRIRDNAVEPEDYAFNWTVRHNRFVDCYAPFSIEPDRSGYFYIYGNLGWSRARPGPDPEDPKDLVTGRLFKFGTEHEAVGPHYVVHNTWFVRNPMFKKKRISNFHHLNNVVAYNENAEDFFINKVNPFGLKWETRHDPDADWDTIKQLEKKRFTKAWKELDITVDNDMVGHPSFPLELISAGYPIGPRASGTAPKFSKPLHGRPDGLKLTNAIAAARVTFHLPDGGKVMNFKSYKHPLCVGAWQDETCFTLPDPLFVSDWEVPKPAS
ncbi:right-handed parallel beta-helix repeat-containing protein [Roseibium sp. MMSF_3544]|uniref:right-handed parallel beta-helix repeat-containing protein n=1 Tax=unclassified Roseibium TaxID=2629323 RepID=UPI00273D0233|nr:right-handed parallel beta-helix repeat-containing protein [Roseibium sp. MMSF_3544]